MGRRAESEEPDVGALDDEVKTVVQISQYNGGQFMKGSKTHTIHGCRAHGIIEKIKSLKEEFKKEGKPFYAVRIQISEYRKNTGAYRKQQGSCVTLYNTTSEEMYDRIGHELNVSVPVRSIEELEEFTSVEGTPLDGYYNPEVHKDLWCLCKQERANSRVLHASDDPRDLIPIQSLYDGFIYWLNPDGKLVLKGELERNVKG